jgi:transposase
MDEYIAFDSHKKYTLAERETIRNGRVRQTRIEHRRGAICRFLAKCQAGTPVAVEATGNWYWIVTEIEEAGLSPRLVHPRKAKLMMGMINKTDKLDVHGLNRLQRNGTLPTVWIPPAGVRDLRELTRTRMVFTKQRARLKNRLTATLAKYGLVVEEYSDTYAVGARGELERLIAGLPDQTRWCAGQLLDELEGVCVRIDASEQRLEALLAVSAEMQLLMTLPGVGKILSAVIWLEMGEVDRFASAERFASYSGTTPRVKSSGDKTRYGRLRPDVNRYLKWSFVEAANSIVRHRGSHPDRHVSRLYERLKSRRGHSKAVGAVARHLAEASWHVLRRSEAYRDPSLGRTNEA